MQFPTANGEAVVVSAVQPTSLPEARQPSAENASLVIADVPPSMPTSAPVSTIVAAEVPVVRAVNVPPTALPFPTLAQPPTRAFDNMFVPLPEAPVPNQMIITFKPELSAAERAAYITSLGGQVVETIDALNTVVVAVSAQTASAPSLASDGLATLQQDYYVGALVAVPPSDPLYGEQWALPVIGAPAAWLTLPANAPSVTVAVIDSGVCADHPDLQGRLRQRDEQHDQREHRDCRQRRRHQRLSGGADAEHGDHFEQHGTERRRHRS